MRQKYTLKEIQRGDEYEFMLNFTGNQESQLKQQ